jgi:hypothetical protein
MHRFIRKFSTVPAVAALMVAVIATPAEAATCSRSKCTGKDPQATGCAADATNLQSRVVKNSKGKLVGRVDIRWSPKCGAVWARTRSESGKRFLVAYLVSCDTGTAYAGTRNGTSVWSPMGANWPQSYRAEGRLYWSDGKGYWSGKTTCFGKD